MCIVASSLQDTMEGRENTYDTSHKQLSYTSSTEKQLRIIQVRLELRTRLPRLLDLIVCIYIDFANEDQIYLSLTVKRCNNNNVSLLSNPPKTANNLTHIYTKTHPSPSTPSSPSKRPSTATHLPGTNARARQQKKEPSRRYGRSSRRPTSSNPSNHHPSPQNQCSRPTWGPCRKLVSMPPSTHDFGVSSMRETPRTWSDARVRRSG